MTGMAPERLAEIRERTEQGLPGRVFEERRELLAEVEQLWGEVSALTIDLARAHEELRQGWPKLARDANTTAIEQWNRADAAEAEVERLRAKVAELELTASIGP